jgi:hypothetical protein
MDWTYAINRHRDAMLRIVAGLFALVGLQEGRALGTLPRHVYRAVLLVLRPAEAAARRLVVIAARGIVLSPCPARAAPVGLSARADAPRNPSFCLIDPLKRFAPLQADTDDSDFADLWNDQNEDEEVSYPASDHALPRISVPGLYDPAFVIRPVPSLEDPINAAQLGRRLLALKLALDHLPRQARRLARWRARRDFLLQSAGPVRPRRLSPLRPGLPPGHRKRQRHDVDEVLLDCHSLALYASKPDTS